MPLKTLLLWDIDGTLITSGGAGMRALRAALQAVFAIDGPINDIDFAGRTDLWIMRQIFAKFALPATEENFARLAEGYVAALPAQLTDRGVQALPGVPALLDQALARGDIALGLLTGNLRRGAEAKLRSRSLWRYFPFGAFADDGEDRNRLGPHALRRARRHHGVELSAAQTWVIGDTPYDVVCARAFAARAIAVATGRYSAEQLQAARPDALFGDLGDRRLLAGGGRGPDLTARPGSAAAGSSDDSYRGLWGHKPTDGRPVILSAAKDPEGRCGQPRLRPAGFFASPRMTRRKQLGTVASMHDPERE